MSDIDNTTTSPPPRRRRRKSNSRATRWADACSKGMKAIDDMRTGLADLEEAQSELSELRQEYEDWKDNLPENLQQSPVGEKLEEVCCLDLEDLASLVVDALDTAESTLEHAEGTDLPLGFGRD